jgi:hypothetical protein
VRFVAEPAHHLGGNSADQEVEGEHPLLSTDRNSRLMGYGRHQQHAQRAHDRRGERSVDQGRHQGRSWFRRYEVGALFGSLPVRAGHRREQSRQRRLDLISCLWWRGGAAGPVTPAVMSFIRTGRERQWL